jgi:hypothetical protein
VMNSTSHLKTQDTSGKLEEHKESKTLLLDPDTNDNVCVARHPPLSQPGTKDKKFVYALNLLKHRRRKAYSWIGSFGFTSFARTRKVILYGKTQSSQIPDQRSEG